MSAGLVTGPVAAARRSLPRHGIRALIAGVLAALVAMLGSWHPSLWSDESATINAATRSLSDLWKMVGNIDLVHGFYYLLMHVWIDLFGTGTFVLRLPSALAVGVAGACLYLIANRLAGASVAAVAAVVFAVLPRVTWAGAEARPYALTMALATACTLMLLLALERARPWLWTLYSLLLVLGILANLFVALIAAGHLVSMIWARHRLTRSQWVLWLLSTIAAGLVCSVFLLSALDQAGQLGERSFSIVDLAQNVAVNQWFLGDTPTTSTGVSMTSLTADPASWWAPASIALAAGCWVLIAIAVVRGLRRSGIDGGPGRVVRWMLPWAVVPTVIIGGYSLVATPMYSPRYLSMAAPAIALLIAVGLLALPRPAWRTAVAAILVVLTVPVYFAQREVNGKNGSDWIDVAGYVAANASPGEGVYFVPRYDVPGDVVGATTRGIQVAYPAAFQGLEDLTLMRKPAAVGNLVGESRRLAASDAELAAVDTVWVVQRRDYPAASEASDLSVLTAGGFHESARWVGPLDEVVRFDRSG
jgi:mannosyltransferase